MKAALLTLALLLLTAPAFAMDASVPEDLHEADYITARDVEANVPYGTLYIDEGVIAIFPRLEDRLSGILIGRARLRLNRLPGAEPGKPQRVIEFKVEQAYLATSPHADLKIQPKGRALQARRWDDLPQDEQQRFLDLYTQALPAGWYAEGAAAGETNPAATARDPQAKEFFAAFWAKPPRELAPAGADAAPTPSTPATPDRFDFRVDASGHNVTLADRTANLVLLNIGPEAAAPDAAAQPAPAAVASPSGG